MNNKEIIIKFLNTTDIPLSAISKDVGISRNTLYNWLKGTPIRAKNEKTFINYINTKINLSGEHNMDAQYIIDLQKEKIERLELDIKKYKKNPVQETLWEDIETHHIYSVVELTFSFPKLLGRKMTQLEGAKYIKQYMGYTDEEIDNYWQIGVNVDGWNKHPINDILTKESIKHIDKQGQSLPVLFESLKDMMGNNMVPTPVTFICKDGSLLPSMCYNKIDWVNKRVETKTQFIIEN